MFDRVEMDVIDMHRKVIIIPDDVFPKPALPDTLFPFSLPGFCYLTFQIGYQEKLAGKSSFDQLPSPGVIIISIR
jgi:hypothetical protein